MEFHFQHPPPTKEASHESPTVCFSESRLVPLIICVLFPSECCVFQRMTHRSTRCSSKFTLKSQQKAQLFHRNVSTKFSIVFINVQSQSVLPHQFKGSTYKGHGPGFCYWFWNSLFGFEGQLPWTPPPVGCGLYTTKQCSLCRDFHRRYTAHCLGVFL